MAQAEFLGNYANITAQTTTVVQSKGGLLHCITVNKPVAAGTIAVYDDPSNTSTLVIGTVTMPASVTNPVTLFYDVQFNKGLTIVTGGATQDLTVSWR